MSLPPQDDVRRFDTQFAAELVRGCRVLLSSPQRVDAVKAVVWLCWLVIPACSVAVIAQAPPRVPRIWDDAALSDWATPVAGLNVRPAHYSSVEYYAAPVDNFRTYPVYHPDKEPPGYWEDLQKKKPEPLVDAVSIRGSADWIGAGKRAFEEMDSALLRTNDPALIAEARNRSWFDRAFTFADGSVVGLRWVVTDRGLMLGTRACGACHIDEAPDGRVVIGGPAGSDRPGARPFSPFGMTLVGAQGTGWRLQRFYNEPLASAVWRDFTVPWATDDRIERFKTMSAEEFQQVAPALFGVSFSRGVFARTNGSPFAVTKIVDLQNLRYSRYIDATATHRLRGPEDVARYAALVTGADRLDFGPHRVLSDEQRRMRFRYADEVLYAIGVYLLSLEPPKNPNPAPADILQRGERAFQREGCVNCHVPPAYTSGKLTLAASWQPPANHPNRDDILAVSVGTDSDAALRTRKGTGLYKIPSLRGVWYRPRLLHDGSLTSLEEMFDPARLAPEYVPRGWSAPGVKTRAVTGHTFGLSLNAEDKAALLAFLRSL